MDKTTETTWASAPLSLRRHPPRLHPRFHRQTKDGTHLIIEAKDEPEPEAEKQQCPNRRIEAVNTEGRWGTEKHWYDNFEDIPKLKERIDA